MSCGGVARHCAAYSTLERLGAAVRARAGGTGSCPAAAAAPALRCTVPYLARPIDRRRGNGDATCISRTSSQA